MSKRAAKPAPKAADKREKIGKTPLDPTRPIGKNNPPIETQFQPGNTASVGFGRPKSMPELKKFVQDIANSELKGTDMTRLEAMVKGMTTSRRQTDNRTVLEYGWGKPKDEVDIVSQNIDLDKLSIRQLEMLANGADIRAVLALESAGAVSIEPAQISAGAEPDIPAADVAG